jgi:hypothetical protein
VRGIFLARIREQEGRETAATKGAVKGNTDDRALARIYQNRQQAARARELRHQAGGSTYNATRGQGRTGWIAPLNHEGVGEACPGNEKKRRRNERRGRLHDGLRSGLNRRGRRKHAPSRRCWLIPSLYQRIDDPPSAPRAGPVPSFAESQQLSGCIYRLALLPLFPNEQDCVGAAFPATAAEAGRFGLEGTGALASRPGAAVGSATHTQAGTPRGRGRRGSPLGWGDCPLACGSWG